MDKKELIEEIKKIKKEKNVFILAHNYQNPEIQDIADYVGDSLAMAKVSAKREEEIILVCGVFFMAETTHMLAPQKKTLIPVVEADCPMARMVNPRQVLELKEKYPDAKVVTYVNSTAAVKAVSDVCCTSSNALSIVRDLDCDKIIFVPDRNLGRNVARLTPKEFIYVDGFCPVHDEVREQEVLDILKAVPGAQLLMHPEVFPDVARHAHKLLSTGGILEYCKTVKDQKIIVGTEVGLMHRLKKEAPFNHYFNIGRDMLCHNMKKITLENVLESLKEEKHEVVLNEELRKKAALSIQKMLEMS